MSAVKEFLSALVMQICCGKTLGNSTARRQRTRLWPSDLVASLVERDIVASDVQSFRIPTFDFFLKVGTRQEPGLNGLLLELAIDAGHERRCSIVADV